MIDVKKILIQGYYGFGNLGDDILMIATFRLVSRWFPKAEIAIYSNAKNNEYIHQLLGKKVELLNLNAAHHFDLIVHGGGGVFFDFEEGSLKQKTLNSTINTIGKRRFSKLYPRFKKLMGKEMKLTTKARLGLGLGIGTYTNSSARYAHNLPVIHSFNHLLVRDQESVSNLKQLGYVGSVSKCTDLAFNTADWLPSITQTAQQEKSVGVILRDWKYDDHQHIRNFATQLAKLTDAGFNFTFYSLAANHDNFYREFMGKNHKVNAWNPNEMTLETYFSELASHQLIVTSRAHGCIISACLGVPPICIEIEPKLKNFAKMFPKGEALIEKDASTERWIKLLTTTSENAQKIKKSLEEEVEENRVLITDGLAFSMQKLKDQHG